MRGADDCLNCKLKFLKNKIFVFIIVDEQNDAECSTPPLFARYVLGHLHKKLIKTLPDVHVSREMDDPFAIFCKKNDSVQKLVFFCISYQISKS